MPLAESLYRPPLRPGPPELPKLGLAAAERGAFFAFGASTLSMMRSGATDRAAPVSGRARPGAGASGLDAPGRRDGRRVAGGACG